MQLFDLLDLTANSPEELIITTSGDTITVKISSLTSAITLWRRHQDKIRQLTEEAHENLKALNMRLVLQVGGRTVARLGAGAEPDFLSKLLDFGPMQLQPYEALRVLFGIEPRDNTAFKSAAGR